MFVTDQSLTYNTDNATWNLLPNYYVAGACGNAQFCPTYWTGANNDGVSVGSWTDSSNVVHGFVFNAPSTFLSFDYSGGVATYPTGINDAGLVTGYYLDSNGMSHGFVYNSKTLLFVIAPLDNPAGTYTTPLGINGYAQIVGYFWDGSSYAGFLYDHTSGNFSSIICSTETIAQGINDNGLIVGYDDISGAMNDVQGFTYNTGSGCSPFTYPESQTTAAMSINDAGQIAGSWNVSSPPGPAFDDTLPIQTTGFFAVPQTP